ESGQELAARPFALHEQRPVESFPREGGGEEVPCDIERTARREQKEGAPAARAQHGQRGSDDRLGVLARIGLGQVARDVEQGLGFVIERRFPASGGCIGKAELALVQRKILADSECRGREYPGASRLSDAFSE